MINNTIFLGKTASKVYVQHVDGDLYEVSGTHLEKLDTRDVLNGTEITSIHELNEMLLITTLKGGLFKGKNGRINPWLIDKNEHLKTLQINTSCLSHKKEIIIGTSFGGVMILNQDGKLEYQLSKVQGLSNNKVISTLLRSETITSGVLWIMG